MTKISKPPPNAGKPHKEGVDKFREIIQSRLTSTGAATTDLFHNKRVETELIKLSGGQPDELMRLVR